MLQMGRIVLRKNINGHARLFNKTAINFFHNYIPNKYTTFNEKDLPWLSDHVRFLTEKKNAVFQKYLKDGRGKSQQSANK